AELAGLRASFREDLSRVAFSPIKAQIGNIAAGSGVDVAATVLSLHHATIPPAINTTKPIDGAKLNVSRQVREKPLKVALSSVYSLGGQNAALVFSVPSPERGA
ncbi:MAG: beta-ketoacyl-[acyl-carrier-protein] synthase II, partial [Tepidisphaeraceae bacterium]